MHPADLVARIGSMIRASVHRRAFITAALSVAAAPAFAAASNDSRFSTSPWRRVSDGEWKRRLPAASYLVLRREGTETAGTSPLLHEHRHGSFVCLACGLPLFKSEWKYDSGTGWPSFWRAIDANLGRKTDSSFLMTRTEYHCAQCLGHQGHLFDDGPRPTGLRYCNNGVGLRFTPG